MSSRLATSDETGEQLLQYASHKRGIVLRQVTWGGVDNKVPIVNTILLPFNAADMLEEVLTLLKNRE